MKTIVVIPHHLPTLDILDAWHEEFRGPDVHVIIVEDAPHRVAPVPQWCMDWHKVTVYTHEDIDRELGRRSWIIPRGTSAIRSFGLYKAWQRTPEMIWTLDNDCYPEQSTPYAVAGHYEALTTPSTLNWVTSTPPGFMDDLSPRGFPYTVRHGAQTAISHGLWSHIPDTDAPTMLLHPDYRTAPLAPGRSIVIPRYNFYPQCSMNLAFRSEVTPLLYHGLFGPKYRVDQYDDMIAGMLAKKVLDHLGLAVRSGYPSVQHRKQSNAFANFRKQAGGLEWNEHFWQAVQQIVLTSTSVSACYRELITALPDTIPGELPGWTKRFKRAALIWSDLFTI